MLELTDFIGAGLVAGGFLYAMDTILIKRSDYVVPALFLTIAGLIFIIFWRVPIQ